MTNIEKLYSRKTVDPDFTEGSTVLILDCSIKGYRGYPRDRIGKSATVKHVKQETCSKEKVVTVTFSDGFEYDFFPSELNLSFGF